MSAQREQSAPPVLFCEGKERRATEDVLTALLGDALARIPHGAVTPGTSATSFEQRLRGFDFDAPQPLGELLPWIVGELEHGIVQFNHPRYFGLFNPAPSFAAECADRIAAAFNPQLATSASSPLPVAIETHVIRAVAARAGFPAGSGGHFTSGGSEANFTALVAALTEIEPDFAADGVRAFRGAPVVYVSEDAHLAWIKIAHQAGIGRSGIRMVATDAIGRMDMAALRSAILADRADGCQPVMLVATAGTTVAGMIDPLPDCVALARETGLWLHVDAAWGGGAIASDRLRPLLDGMGEADSATIDGHKWFATTMGCGMFLTRHVALLDEAFHVANAFMPSVNAHRDPYLASVQWSRRFVGLRLFLSLANVGWRGHAAHVEHSADLIDELRWEMSGRGWRVANDSALGVLCLDSPEAARIARAVVEGGEAWISSPVFRGRNVLRICVTNGRTTQDDMHALATLLDASRRATTPIDFVQAQEH
jgi:glutamate/tyrosine decarboxylase-like PLP-dependent enzyme